MIRTFLSLSNFLSFFSHFLCRFFSLSLIFSAVFFSLHHSSVHTQSNTFTCKWCPCILPVSLVKPSANLLWSDASLLPIPVTLGLASNDFVPQTLIEFFLSFLSLFLVSLFLLSPHLGSDFGGKNSATMKTATDGECSTKEEGC